jgi:hypothetical protein
VLGTGRAERPLPTNPDDSRIALASETAQTSADPCKISAGIIETESTSLPSMRLSSMSVIPPPRAPHSAASILRVDQQSG